MATESVNPTSPGTHVQAGGGTSSEQPSMRLVETIGPSILPYMKAIADGSRPLDSLQLKELKTSQTGTGNKFDLKALLDYLASSAGNALAPLPEADLTHPMPEYFISSSHNTYLTGNQLYGDASTEAYRNVLLRGCRCIEIDVWDGEERDEDEEDEHAGGKQGFRSRISNAIRERKQRDDLKASAKGEQLATEPPHKFAPSNPLGAAQAEPRVLHGHTLTKEVSFRDVCAAIKETAFVNSDLPVIVSLEVHARAKQQELMIEIMQQSWGSMLAIPPAQPSGILPSPSELKHKILIKVKAASHSKAVVGVPEPADVKGTDIRSESSESETDTHLQTKQQKPAKKSKIIEALSAMGVYLQGYHFSKLDSPEAVIPSHVFSVSEKKIVQVHEYFGPALFSHNMKYFMRAYPSGTRVSSSNLDPSIYWRKFGVQLVALNWQRIDAGVMLNEGQFAGSGGWVLKPAGYRNHDPSTTTTSEVAGSRVVPCQQFKLLVEVLAAQNLPHKSESKGERLHPYVKCQAHVGSSQEHIGMAEDGRIRSQEVTYKLRTKASKGTSPDFGGELLQFSPISTVEALSFLRFKVQNDHYGRDTLLAWACIRLDRLHTGYRLLHLLDAKGFESQAVLLINIRKEVIS